MNNEKITVNTPINDAGFSVTQFNHLYKMGYRTVGDIVNGTAMDIYMHHLMPTHEIGAVLLHLDECGLRCVDCSYNEYPDLPDAIGYFLKTIREQAESKRSHAWNYHKVFPKLKFDPAGIIMPYTEMLIPNIEPSDARFYIISQEEYKIKACGVLPGGIVVFDRSLPFIPGMLSCFQDDTGMICFTNQDKELLHHIGRAIAVINYLETQNG